MTATPAPAPTTPSDDGRLPVRRALVSVYDKTGLTDLGRELAAAGVEIVSTGSTAQTLRDAGIAVTEVATVTGFPEVLDGRVKTLHPRIHAGLLADRRRPEHVAQLAEHDIAPFDLVVVNLYPFEQTVASGASFDECIELIDIGGPAMVRAAAKNHANLAVVVDQGDYAAVAPALAAGGFTADERRFLAARAFDRTARYDSEVARYLQGEQPAREAAPPADGDAAPDWLLQGWQRRASLRYGENPHQPAALYAPTEQAPVGLAAGVRRDAGGKEMSYNNYVDADAALRAVALFDAATEVACAIMKHNNPCGLALGADPAEAYQRAFACDPTSAYGSVVAFNRPVTRAAAERIATVFTEVLLAPGFEDGALAALAGKKNLRILEVPATDQSGWQGRLLQGGAALLLQRADTATEPGDQPDGWTRVTQAGADLDARTMADLAFAWRAIAAVKSNAILLADGAASVGIGMGQVNRVDSARLAVERAGAERARAAVAASDAFFPFPDGLQVLAEAGVRAVVQPGGSIRDDEVIAAADAAGVAMFLTGVRHFTH